MLERIVKSQKITVQQWVLLTLCRLPNTETNKRTLRPQFHTVWIRITQCNARWHGTTSQEKTGYGICSYCMSQYRRAYTRFLSRDIANRYSKSVWLSVCLSVRPPVRYVPVPYENGLTYHHSFFSPYGSQIILVLSASNIFTKFQRGYPLRGR